MSQNSLRGVFVVDQYQSPLWRTAQSHVSSHDIALISANKFLTASRLAKKIVSFRPEFVIFSWRGAFDAVLSSRRARLTLLSSDTSIFLLIPDLIGIHHFSKQEEKRVALADGVLVTSMELREKYHLNYSVENLQILHDYPPFEDIDSIFSESIVRNPNQIVWVGNSQWGSHMGFIDHKGLNSFAIPVIEEIKRTKPELTFLVIDSAVEKLPYENVLRCIRESACLIFTSNSEGTGLPLIESAYLGTPIITLKVGIAPEILKGDLESLISPRNVQVFAKKVLMVLSNLEFYSSYILKEAIRYRIDIANDFDSLDLRKHQNAQWRKLGMSMNLTSRLKWIYRWLHYLLIRFNSS